ncbi:MAG: hypothetical protein K6G74_01795 [Bacilli bacterium]|nr:hypothetical protein [Bacilli bacterium]
MERFSEEEKRSSHSNTFIFATIAALLVILLTYVSWQIDFIALRESINEEEAGEVFGLFFALIIMALPLLGSIIGGFVLSAIFAPLSFAVLRKSSIHELSVLGLVYGIFFSLAGASAVIRFILMMTGVL